MDILKRFVQKTQKSDMELSYKKLFDVNVRHDYYLEGLDNQRNSIWPDNYNILDDLEFIPTLECTKLLEDFQMVLKPCSTGFKVYVRALESVIRTNEYKSFIELPDYLKLTFLIRVKNSFFSNYTNLRLPGEGKYLYYFSNRSGHAYHTIPFLTLPMLRYNDLPSDDLLQWGDLIRSGNMIREAKQIINPRGGFHPNQWVTHNIADARYVTTLDRIRWQSPDFTFEALNDHLGEIIKFELRDIEGNRVSLGNIPNTDVSQDTFTTPNDSAHPVHHKLNFDHVPSGKYTLTIHKTTAEPDSTFYLLDPLLYRDIFGVVELYTHVPQASLRFLRHRSSGDLSESLISEKSYQIRFKNRLTTWKYIFPDESEIVVDIPRGLSRFPTEYKHNGSSVILPDPDINLIDPIRDSTNPELIANIYSEIFLNEQFNTI